MFITLNAESLATVHTHTHTHTHTCSITSNVEHIFKLHIERLGISEN